MRREISEHLVIFEMMGRKCIKGKQQEKISDEHTKWFDVVISDSTL